MSRRLYTILSCKTAMGRQLPGPRVRGLRCDQWRVKFRTPLGIAPQPDKAAGTILNNPSLCQVITFRNAADSQSIKPGISARVPLSPVPTLLHLFFSGDCSLLRETLPQYYGPRRR